MLRRFSAVGAAAAGTAMVRAVHDPRRPLYTEQKKRREPEPGVPTAEEVTQRQLAARFADIQAARRKSKRAAEANPASKGQSVYGAVPGDKGQASPQAQTQPKGKAGVAAEFLQRQSDSAGQPFERTTAFMKNVNKLHEDYYEGRKGVNETLAREKKREKVLEERRKILTFRNVDADLDSLKLHRDLFLWLKCAWKGKQYLIDLMLERELRFYADDAMIELKACDLKIIHGLPRLMKPVHKFPNLKNLIRLSSSSTHAERAKTDDGARLVGPGGATGKGKSVLISSGSFQRPTVVTLSPLAFGMVNGDEDWIGLLDPARRIEEVKGLGVEGATKEEAEKRAADLAAAGKKLAASDDVDIVRIRSADHSSVRLMMSVTANSTARHFPYDAARNAFVGDRLVREFMPTLGLRNFATNYVFLVDCEGYVRWVGAGLPSLAEAKVFSSLVDTLRTEYYRKKR